MATKITNAPATEPVKPAEASTSAAAPANGKKTYRTLKPVALGASFHDKGVEVTLSDRQAEFLRVSGAIEPVELKEAAK